MDSGDLSTAQAEAMRDRLRLYANYLHRLRRRMDRRGFPLNDELLLATDRAYDEARGLVMMLHYLGCKSGVARLRKPKEGNKDAERRSEPSGNH